MRKGLMIMEFYLFLVTKYEPIAKISSKNVTPETTLQGKYQYCYNILLFIDSLNII